MKYSPKLKEAMRKIKEICKQHDIAGVVVLHTAFQERGKKSTDTTGFSEVELLVNPSYSCAEWMPNKKGIWIRGKKIHHNNDGALRDFKLSATINMFNQLGMAAGEQSLNLLQIADQAQKTWETEHTDRTHFGTEEHEN
jgi:hypothetical protein